MRAILRSFPFLVIALGCACSGAPLDRAESLGKRATDTRVADVPTRGYLVKITSIERRRERGVLTIARHYEEGELLAVDESYLYLWRGGHRVAVPRRSITKVAIEIHDSASAEVATVTALGTLSTVSHGMFLILSAPVWLISGISASIGESLTNDVVVERERLLDALYQYARYPQGLPPRWPTEETAPPLPPPALPPPPEPAEKPASTQREPGNAEAGNGEPEATETTVDREQPGSETETTATEVEPERPVDEQPGPDENLTEP